MFNDTDVLNNWPHICALLQKHSPTKNWEPYTDYNNSRFALPSGQARLWAAPNELGLFWFIDGGKGELFNHAQHCGSQRWAYANTLENLLAIVDLHKKYLRKNNIFAEQDDEETHADYHLRMINFLINK